ENRTRSRHAQQIIRRAAANNMKGRKMSQHQSVASEYYSQALHGPYQVYDAGDLGLESGGKLRGL
ncbi:hypothetical protein OFC23_32200, partial [Escherichia coli]|nr:hypothetical protein [Escherichia coli]